MSEPAGDVHEVLLPPGIGMDHAPNPGATVLVGSSRDLRLLAATIECQALAERWTADQARVADLLSRPVGELLEALAGFALYPAIRPVPADDGPSPADVVEAGRLQSMAATAPVTPVEEDRGPCGLLGCRQDGPHIHRRWDTARATGSLTGQLAESWGVATWGDFLKAHDLGQPEALAALRAHDAAQGMAEADLPSGLRSIVGRPDLAQVLIDLADARREAARAAGEPF